MADKKPFSVTLRVVAHITVHVDATDEDTADEEVCRILNDDDKFAKTLSASFPGVKEASINDLETVQCYERAI